MTKITTEELEKFLRSNKSRSISLYDPTSVDRRGRVKKHKSILTFIKHYQLKPGTVLIPTYLIYYYYKVKYSHSHVVKVGKTEFFRVFNMFFEQKRKTNQRYYLLDDSLEITDEILTLAKSHSRSKNSVKNKKESK